jgi:glutamine synthetase
MVRYLEDRRPAANMDPYLVSAALVDVTLLKSKNLKELEAALARFTQVDQLAQH